jgi:hypothetical protein
MQPLKRRDRPDSNPSGPERPDTAVPSNEQEQESHSSTMPFQDSNESNIVVDTSSFWFPLSGPLETAGYRLSPQLLSMDWSAAGFPDNGRPYSYHVPLRVTAQGAYHVADEAALREDQQQLAEQENSFLPNAIAPNFDQEFHQVSGRVASASGESRPSTGVANLEPSPTHEPAVEPVPAMGPDDTLRQPTNILPADAHEPDWPETYSLDSYKGHSTQLIGLSCESDPYLLRHYQFTMQDMYPMHRLHFRNIMGDSWVQPPHTLELECPRMPKGYLPIQFAVTDELIWKDELESVNRLFSGGRSECDDVASLRQLVPFDRGLRLRNL